MLVLFLFLQRREQELFRAKLSVLSDTILEFCCRFLTERLKLRNLLHMPIMLSDDATDTRTNKGMLMSPLHLRVYVNMQVVLLAYQLQEYYIICDVVAARVIQTLGHAWNSLQYVTEELLISLAYITQESRPMNIWQG